MRKGRILLLKITPTMFHWRFIVRWQCTPTFGGYPIHWLLDMNFHGLNQWDVLEGDLQSEALLETVMSLDSSWWYTLAKVWAGDYIRSIVQKLRDQKVKSHGCFAKSCIARIHYRLPNQKIKRWPTFRGFVLSFWFLMILLFKMKVLRIPLF